MTEKGTATALTRIRFAGLPAAFWRLWLAELVVWAGRFVVPFLTLYLTRDAGLQAGQAGLILACYGVPAYLASVTVWTLGELGLHPSAQVTAADLAPSWLRGRYQGAYALAWSGASIAAPAAGGMVLDRLGPRAVWLAGAADCVLIAGVLAATGRQRERRLRDVTALNRCHDEVTAPCVPAVPGS